MKNFKAIIILILTLQFLFSCDSKNKKVLIASDEIHFIELDSKNHFELIYNGYNKVSGTYSISGDSIFLVYNNSKSKIDLNQRLTRTLIIDSKSKKVKSLDNKQFCAFITLDERTSSDK